MKAVTVVPGTAGSVRVDEVPEPDPALGSVLVEALAVGICGTDAEIASGEYGWAPPGRDRLILGHESLGRVVDPARAGFAVGEHVVGIVRRPDPEPCPNCAVGEWDMCSNGRYTERGIKQVDGFMAERWRIEPEYAVRVEPSLGALGVLLEPTTVVAKAWEQIAAIGRRTFWDPRRGPGRRSRADRAARCPDRRAARARGPCAGPGDERARNRRWSSSWARPTTRERSPTWACSPDIVVECTGVASLIRQTLATMSPGGIVCLLGVGAPVTPRRRSGDCAGDRRGAEEPRCVRLGECQPAPLLLCGEGARRGGPFVARAAGHPAGRPGQARPGAAAGTGRHQGRHGVRAGLSLRSWRASQIEVLTA